MKILIFCTLCFFAGCGVQFLYLEQFPKSPWWIGLILSGILVLFSGRSLV